MQYFFIVIETDDPYYVRYTTSIINPCIWMQEVPVEFLHGAVRNAIRICIYTECLQAYKHLLQICRNYSGDRFSRIQPNRLCDRYITTANRRSNRSNDRSLSTQNWPLERPIKQPICQSFKSHTAYRSLEWPWVSDRSFFKLVDRKMTVRTTTFSIGRLSVVLRSTTSKTTDLKLTKNVLTIVLW